MKKVSDFVKTIDTISKVLKTNGVEIELVGSFVLFLHGLLTFDKVHDIDLVLYTPNKDSINSILSLIAPDSTSGYDSNMCMSSMRYSFKFNDIDICLFITDSFEEAGKTDMLYTTFNGCLVKPVSEIIAVKGKACRDKDKNHLTDIIYNVISSFDQVNN